MKQTCYAGGKVGGKRVDKLGDNHGENVGITAKPKAIATRKLPARSQKPDAL